MNGSGMLAAALFGSHTATDETFGNRTDLELFEQEERTLAHASPERLAEFRTARSCAREALRTLGEPMISIPVGADRAPVWPAGIVGSITHCVGYRAAVVAKREHVLSVGVDAEPDAPLPPGVARAIFTVGEAAATRGLPAGINWDRLLFSAKESLFKLQAHLEPGHRIEITQVLADGTIRTTPGPPGAHIDAGWIIGPGLIVTAATAHRVHQRPGTAQLGEDDPRAPSPGRLSGSTDEESVRTRSDAVGQTGRSGLHLDAAHVPTRRDH